MILSTIIHEILYHKTLLHTMQSSHIDKCYVILIGTIPNHIYPYFWKQTSLGKTETLVTQTQKAARN